MNASGEDLEEMNRQMEIRQAKNKAEKKAKKSSKPTIKVEVPDEVNAETSVSNSLVASTSSKDKVVANSNMEKLNGDKNKQSKYIY